MTYNKLVRNRIPEIIAKDGKTVTFRMLNNNEEYIKALHDKLDEEVAEFHKEPTVEELIDIVEVAIALADEMGYNSMQFMRQRMEKEEFNGNFSKRIFLESVE